MIPILFLLDGKTFRRNISMTTTTFIHQSIPQLVNILEAKDESKELGLKLVLA